MRLSECKRYIPVRVVRLDHRGDVDDDKENLRGMVGKKGRIVRLVDGDRHPVAVRVLLDARPCIYYFKPGELEPVGFAQSPRSNELKKLRHENNVLRNLNGVMRAWLDRWDRMHNVMPGFNNPVASRLVPLKEIRLAKMGVALGRRSKPAT